MILNSLRQGNKPAHLKTTLLLLADIVELGYKYARLILIQFDFNHRNLPYLLLQKDRKVRSIIYLIMFLTGNQWICAFGKVFEKMKQVSFLKFMDK